MKFANALFPGDRFVAYFDARAVSPNIFFREWSDRRIRLVANYAPAARSFCRRDRCQAEARPQIQNRVSRPHQLPDEVGFRSFVFIVPQGLAHASRDLGPGCFENNVSHDELSAAVLVPFSENRYAKSPIPPNRHADPSVLATVSAR